MTCVMLPYFFYVRYGHRISDVSESLAAALLAARTYFRQLFFYATYATYDGSRTVAALKWRNFKNFEIN